MGRGRKFSKDDLASRVAKESIEEVVALSHALTKKFHTVATFKSAKEKKRKVFASLQKDYYWDVTAAPIP